MAQSVTLDGVVYSVPEDGETGWADDATDVIFAAANVLEAKVLANTLSGTHLETGDSANRAIDEATLSTSGTLAENSDTRVATQKATKTYADTKVATASIVNDLTTGGTTVPLSAEQGKTLQTTKVAIASIVNDLTTGGTTVPLSAEQGKTLQSSKVATSSIVNDLTTGGTTVPLSAEQGKTLQTTKVAGAGTVTSGNLVKFSSTTGLAIAELAFTDTASSGAMRIGTTLVQSGTTSGTTSSTTSGIFGSTSGTQYYTDVAVSFGTAFKNATVPKVVCTGVSNCLAAYITGTPSNTGFTVRLFWVGSATATAHWIAVGEA